MRAKLRRLRLEKLELRRLRLEKLERTLKPFLAVKDSPRPQRGWIRAIREATGVTVREMARRLGKDKDNFSGVLYLEKSETEYRLILGNLREAADALGCQLVYAIVPKNGSIYELSEQSERAKKLRKRSRP
jgi:predicted DNA-binding mobile mystery protein A